MCLVKTLPDKIQWEKILMREKEYAYLIIHFMDVSLKNLQKNPRGQNFLRKKEYIITYWLPLMRTSIQRLVFSYPSLFIILLNIVVSGDLVNESSIVLLEQTCCILIPPFLGAHDCRKTLTKYAFFYMILWIFPSRSNSSPSFLLQLL